MYSYIDLSNPAFFMKFILNTFWKLCFWYLPYLEVLRPVLEAFLIADLVRKMANSQENSYVVVKVSWNGFMTLSFRFFSFSYI